MKECSMESLPPWELLLKKIVWTQLGDIQGKRILDFGSGIGVTANHYARHNAVVAVELSRESAAQRWQENPYRQLIGSTDILRELQAESFDVILCHNVLEYAPDRESILREFSRLLKPDGVLSIVKHNRPGRVMQMAVLLDDFEKANALLDGRDGASAQYGAIRYYEDSDVTKWCGDFRIVEVSGIRTFWDLQQNQERHRDPEWRAKMLELELRVSRIDAYRDIAFFHHLIVTKVKQ